MSLQRGFTGGSLLVARSFFIPPDGTPAGTSESIKFMWTKPRWAINNPNALVIVTLCGAGGGGGSGRLGAAGTVRIGGAGGGSGAWSFFECLAVALPGQVSVQVGIGGSGGAAQTTLSTNGNAGSAGGDTMFGSSQTTDNYCYAGGGGGGLGGTTSSPVSGGTRGARAMWSGAIGQNSESRSATGDYTSYGKTIGIMTGGGAAGGDIFSDNVIYVGSGYASDKTATVSGAAWYDPAFAAPNWDTGGPVWSPRFVGSVNLGGVGGKSGGGAGRDGLDFTPLSAIGGFPGSGGGASNTAATTGGNGGRGGKGSGGGGGGAALNTTTNGSGAGGAGGHGFCQVMVYG